MGLTATVPRAPMRATEHLHLGMSVGEIWQIALSPHTPSLNMSLQSSSPVHVQKGPSHV